MRDNNPDALQQTNKLILWRPRSNKTVAPNKKRVPAAMSHCRRPSLQLIASIVSIIILNLYYYTRCTTPPPINALDSILICPHTVLLEYNGYEIW